MQHTKPAHDITVAKQPRRGDRTETQHARQSTHRPVPLVRRLAPGDHGRVRFVHRKRRAGTTNQSGGPTDVVDVAVGDDDRAHVLRAEPGTGQVPQDG